MLNRIVSLVTRSLDGAQIGWAILSVQKSPRGKEGPHQGQEARVALGTAGLPRQGLCHRTLGPGRAGTAGCSALCHCEPHLHLSQGLQGTCVSSKQVTLRGRPPQGSHRPPALVFSSHPNTRTPQARRMGRPDHVPESERGGRWKGCGSGDTS